MEPISEEQGRQPVLIRRIRGIEDSSRHWSLYMTLDHLRIVNHGIAGIIRALTRDETSEIPATTIADVKPSPDAGPDQVQAFQETCGLYLSTIERIEDLNTQRRHPHPWFGPMNAFAWHGLAAGHMSIHRNQIVRILAGLSQVT